MKTKHCNKCEQDKSIDEFYFYAKNWCKSCYAVYRAFRRDKLRENKREALDEKRIKTEREKYITIEEWKIFKKHITSDTYKLFWNLIAYTGLRLREALEVKRSQVDFDHYVLMVPTLKRKGIKRPILPVDLPPKLCEEIHGMDKGKLFAFNAHSAWSNFKLTCRRAKLNKKYSPHSLRHMMGMSVAKNTKGDPYKIKAKLRHATISSGERYVHLLPELRMKLSKEIWDDMEDDDE